MTIKCVEPAKQQKRQAATPRERRQDHPGDRDSGSAARAGAMSALAAVPEKITKVVEQVQEAVAPYMKVCEAQHCERCSMRSAVARRSLALRTRGKHGGSRAHGSMSAVLRASAACACGAGMRAARDACTHARIFTHAPRAHPCEHAQRDSCAETCAGQAVTMLLFDSCTAVAGLRDRRAT